MRPAKSAPKKARKLNIDENASEEMVHIPFMNIPGAGGAAREDKGLEAARKALERAEAIITEVSQALEILRVVDLDILKHPNRITHLDGVSWGFQSFGAILSSHTLDAENAIFEAKEALGLSKRPR